MKRNHEALLLFLYRLLNTGVFSSAVILYFSDLFGKTGVTWKHVTVLLLTAAVFWSVRELDKRQRIHALLAMILFLVILSGMTGQETCKAWIYARSGFLWTIFFAVSAGVLEFLFEKYFPLKIATAAIVCALLIGSLIAGRHVPRTGVVFFLLYVLITLAEAVRTACGKKNGENAHAYLLWITPFLALYFFVLCLMPAPETPYSWQWLKDICLRTEERVGIYVERMINGNREDLDGAVSGFSGQTPLFSYITAENKNMLVIETLSGKRQPLYLAGKTYDSFDGRSWESTEEGCVGERLLDTIETVYALERYAQNDPGHPVYYHNVCARAEYRHLRTAYLLAPAKTWKIEGKPGYRQSGATLVFDKKAGYGTEYTFTFCRMNLERERMRDFLRSALPMDEELWENTVKRYAKEDIPYEEFRAYRESVYARYLQETTVSPEVEEWLAAVTEDAENDLDKLFLIEEAMADMQYNENPGGLPEDVADGQGFLAYFLAEKPEGFCSHFATAFVLLARAEGFPARYVQGFCIPMENAGVKEVYSNMAHAWPEVYVEGKGWIPFEPTPGYGMRRYAADGEKTDKAGGLSKTQIRMEKEQGEDSGEASKEQEEREKKKREERKRAVLFLCKCVLFLITTSVIVFVIDKLGEKRREKGRSLDEKYRREVLRNLQILSMLGYERGQSETYQEFSARIGIGDDGNVIPTVFLETYESILYGTREAGEHEMEECLEKGEELMRILRKEKGRRYLFYRIKLYHKRL